MAGTDSVTSRTSAIDGRRDDLSGSGCGAFFRRGPTPPHLPLAGRASPMKEDGVQELAEAGALGAAERWQAVSRHDRVGVEDGVHERGGSLAGDSRRTDGPDARPAFGIGQGGPHNHMT